MTADLAMSGPTGCHLCGAAELVLLPEFAAFRRVTSDCRPWPVGGQLGVCQACGCAQKPVSDAWQRETEQIYAGYKIYHQAGGAEQAVFQQESGAPSARSSRIVDFLDRTGRLPSRGRLLEIGAGNGAFLRAFAESHPEWTLAALELDDNNRHAIESIRGVESLYTGDLDEIPGRFDFVVLVHVLEHIPSPAAYLARLHAKLAPQALLLAQTPDHHLNPFDLVVADHCSHLSLGSLSAVVGGAGYQVIRATNDCVPREATCLAETPSESMPLPERPPAPQATAIVRQRLQWLRALRDQAMELSRRGPLGIFGTSIAAVWLDSELGQSACQFFVDEDVQRTKFRLADRPVYHPGDVPAGACVLLALPRGLAESVLRRLGPMQQAIDYRLPPDDRPGQDTRLAASRGRACESIPRGEQP